MLRSMTAYGRANQKFENGDFTVEVQSVNRKHLDIHVQIPHELAQFEIDVKKWISQTISRGSVTVKVFASFDNITPFYVKPNLALAKQFRDAWDQIARHLGVTTQGFNLSLISGVEDLMIVEDRKESEELYRVYLENVLNRALEGFHQMKAREGAHLQEDIENRLRQLQGLIHVIEEKSGDAVRKNRLKLMARLEEVLPGKMDNEEKILREIAVYAEKIDIAEEITRFKSHLIKFQEIMNSPEHSVGKTLEFILQELNREINTITNKANDFNISNLAIDIKSKLEQIREQVQNVE